MVHEALALASLGTAAGRWGKIRVAYPRRGVWHENPYHLPNVAWSTPEHRDAAKRFQDFLLGRGAQRLARDRWLSRSANLERPIAERGSALSRPRETGRIDAPAIQRPRASRFNQRLQVWRRVR